MKHSERAAYIKGLCEGSGIDMSAGEGRIIAEMLSLIGDMAGEMDELQKLVVELGDELDDISEELSGFYADEDEDDEDDDEDGCGCGCPHLHVHGHDGEDNHGALYEVKCPKCSELLYLDEDLIMQGGTECPGCGEHLDFDLDDDEDHPQH